MDFKIPKHSIIYLLVCLSGILIFPLLGILPSYSTLARIEDKREDLNARLEEQKTLGPLYKTLQGQKKKNLPRLLPFSRPALVQGAPMGELNEKFKEAARLANVELLSLTPVISSLSSSSTSLTMEATARGDFLAFRKFIIGLEGLPSLEHIEEIRMEQTPRGTELKLTFRVLRG